MNERGSVTIEWILMTGVALFPAMMLLAMVGWPARWNAASAAAYEAARIAVEAPTWAQGTTDGEARAAEIMENHGYALAGISWDGDLARGASVTATVTVTMPALTIPFVGSWAAVDVDRTSTQRVADYRSIGD